MQRRAGPTASSPSSGNPPIPTTIGGTRGGGHFPPRRNKKKKLNPVLLLICLAVVLLVVSVVYFPSQVLEVEREAEHVGQELASRARQAEHKVEELLLHQQPGGGSVQQQHQDPSARMLAQSSKWVDGEKKLKVKLKELEALQQKGEYLGAPVLTRWLGDDVPAWVSKDVNEEEWKKTVQRKYDEMRQEEEEWKAKMQQIINQREREMGITTTRWTIENH